MGRTGRHKAGRVVYIMSQGKEEDSYRKGLQVSFDTSRLVLNSAIAQQPELS